MKINLYEGEPLIISRGNKQIDLFSYFFPDVKGNIILGKAHYGEYNTDIPCIKLSDGTYRVLGNTWGVFYLPFSTNDINLYAEGLHDGTFEPTSGYTFELGYMDEMVDYVEIEGNTFTKNDIEIHDVILKLDDFTGSGDICKLGMYTSENNAHIADLYYLNGPTISWDNLYIRDDFSWE